MAKGLTLKEALSISPRHLRSMSEKALRKVVSTVRSVARKRYERIIESGVYSPAAVSLVKSAKGDEVMPTVKGMDITQLRNEYKRLRGFIENKTSTITGAKETQVSFRRYTEEILKRELTDAETTEVWRIVDELQQSDAIGMSRTHGDTNGKAIAEYVGNLMISNPDLTHEDIVELAREKARSLYEESQRESMPYGDITSRFYDVD